jgi:hypothetical protein
VNTVIQCASKGCGLRRQWEMDSLDARDWILKVSKRYWSKVQEHTFNENLAICLPRLLLSAVLLDLLRILVLRRKLSTS